jgi:hypothetical protein
MIIISNALDDSSSGLVIRNFIKNAKSSGKNIQGFFETVGINDRESNVFSFGGLRFLDRIDKILMILLRDSLFCKHKARTVYNKHLRTHITDNNSIVVFVTGINFFTLYVSRLLILKKRGIDINIHFLDTIVSKNPWGENRFVTLVKKEIIRKTCRELIGKVNFSFTNTMAKNLIEEILDKKLYGRIFYSYKIFDYQFYFNKIHKKRIIFYFRGTLDQNRKSDYILSVFNEFSEKFKEFEFVFQGRIISKTSSLNFPGVRILDFSSSTEWLEKADVFIDIDLYLPDVYIPGKFFEYLGYGKPILSITPYGSALRNLFNTDLRENSLIHISEFDEFSILQQLELIKENLKNGFNCSLKFNNVLTLEKFLH